MIHYLTLQEHFVGYKDGNTLYLGVDLPELTEIVRPGIIVRLADGAISIQVDHVSPARGVEGTIMNDGSLGERKVVHIAGVTIRNPMSNLQDMQIVQEFAVQHQVDFVAPSQVGSRNDVEELRRFLDNCGGDNIKIIAKIETEQGLRNFDDILESADAIMLARGALGLAIAPEKVALAQCNIITKAKIAGKPVIVARQMLESMVSNPRPTRAEMTDVANAVLDSADCVMLCSETSSGMFPVDSFITMANICKNAEAAMNYSQMHSFIRDFSAKPFNTVEAAAVSLAKGCMDAKLGLAIVLSNSGDAANIVAKYRPNVPQIVVTSQPPVVKQCNLIFGQIGFLVDWHEMQDLAEVDSIVEK